MIKKYLLLTTLILISFNGVSQNNYAVTSIPFIQYIASSAALATADDNCSGLILLPFSFDFYGITYNQVVISTNGYVDFRSSSANTTSPFAFSQTIPNSAFPVKNSIFGAYSDLNNSNGEGTITYGVYGTAPYRKFVVYFYNNSFFSCTAVKSTFQMILHETSNIVDVQLIDKQACTNWNSGRTVTGLINLTGSQGIAPPNRNTGSWTAFHEGWRFSRAGYYTNYSFVRCDDNNDGFAMFDLNVAASDLSPANPSNINFYLTLADAQTGANSLQSPYVNQVANLQNIYASGNGAIKPIILSVIDCNVDVDNDSVDTNLEDANSDTNLANDDTDGDGMPNYVDNDDDGDLILTNLEYVFGKNVVAILDTDNDTIPNYLDKDDDGDGILTYNEDYNGDGNPANDDTNSDGTPDYLQQSVALGLQNSEYDSLISIYPNPTSDVLYVDNQTSDKINSIEIISMNGAIVKQEKGTSNLQSISVSNLQSGIYFVKMQLNNQVLNYKFIKK